jgi:hypothetical protein
MSTMPAAPLLDPEDATPAEESTADYDADETGTADEED